MARRQSARVPLLPDLRPAELQLPWLDRDVWRLRATSRKTLYRPWKNNRIHWPLYEVRLSVELFGELALLRGQPRCRCRRLLGGWHTHCLRSSAARQVELRHPNGLMFVLSCTKQEPDSACDRGLSIHISHCSYVCCFTIFSISSHCRHISLFLNCS